MEDSPKIKRPDYYFEGIKKFNKKITSKTLMQSDIAGDEMNDKSYLDKIAKVFEMRSHKIKAK